MKYLIILTLTFPIFGFSHSGGTDSYGCHTNHKTGDYHCHNPKLKKLKINQDKNLAKKNKTDSRIKQ